MFILDERYLRLVQQIRTRSGIPPMGFKKETDYHQWITDTFDPKRSKTKYRSHALFEIDVYNHFEGLVPDEAMTMLQDFISCPAIWKTSTSLVGVNWFSEDKTFVSIFISPLARQQDVLDFFSDSMNWAEIKSIQKNSFERELPRFKVNDISFYIRLKELKDQGYTYKKISTMLKTEGLTSLPPTVLRDRWKWISRLMRVHLPPPK